LVVLFALSKTIAYFCVYIRNNKIMEETKKFKLTLLDKAILNKLKEFETVKCPTPKRQWWADAFDSSEPTIRFHFRKLEEHGFIVKINKFDFITTEKW